jgi:hypothetical protein
MKMTIAFDDALRQMINDSHQINKKVFTTDRCVILLLLYCCKDGLQYREIKNLLKISDGKLIADLNTLEKEIFISKHFEKLDNKTLDVYIISEKGVSEIKKCREFFTLHVQLQEMCE